MPLYEYECLTCRKHTEKIQKFSDPEITVCPYCGGDLKRVISAPAFSMKGGGWYADGYGSVKPPSGGEKSDTATGDKGAAPAASSDSATPASAPAAAAAPSAPAPAASSSDKS